MAAGWLGGRSGGARITPPGERPIASDRPIERDAAEAAARHRAGREEALAR